MKKRNQKGFTLAELLIVVAIIAVLVAIAIPVFSSQLEKSRESTDVSNVRSAAAEVVATYLSEGSAKDVSVTAKQKDAGWLIGSDAAVVMQQIDGKETPTSIPSDKVAPSGKYTVGVTASGTVEIK